MKKNNRWGHIGVLFLTMIAAVFMGTQLIRADEAVVTEIRGSMQLIRELSKNWDEEGMADTADESCPTNQILIFSDGLSDDYGAVKVLHYEEIGIYYLQYATAEDTQKAYKHLKKRYGKSCVLDQVIKAEEWQQSAGVSWGSVYTGLDQLRLTPAVKSLGGTVTVAVVDTGINMGHSLFFGRKISSASRNLVENNTNVSDVTGHGTHVAGVIADCTPAQVEILAVRIYNDKGMSSIAMVQAGILYALQKGADVINLSLGDVNHIAGDDWLEECITAAWEKGVPLVCAAGNSKKDVSTCYPACDRKTIAVSAIDRNGVFARQFNYLEGSNYGSGIDFAAPGVSIASASTRNNYDLDYRSGTSMAAPFVSAAAAYVKLALPQSTVSQVKSILQNYAVDYGTPGKDDYYGYGVIRMDRLQIDISGNVSMSLNTSSMVYSGSPCCPEVYVNGIPAGQYTVSYADNTRPGTAAATVSGTGVFSGSVSTTFRILLGTPQLNTVKCAPKGIQIQWEQLPGADGYVILRSKNNGSFSRLKTVGSSSTNFTDTGVTSGKIYRYRIQAVSSAISSDYSVTKNTMFVKSASLTDISNTARGIALKWKKVSGISGYYIYRKSAADPTWRCLKQVTSASTTSATDTKAVQGEQYTYQIIPYKKSSGQKYKGSAANEKTMIRMKRMNAPTLKNIGSRSVRVYWKSAKAAEGYQIRYSLKKNMSSSKTMKVTSPQQLTATISRLKKNKTYYVQIRAWKRTGNGTACGPWSSKKSVRIRK